MSRSLKVRSDSIKQAKLALQHNGFGSQRSCAEELGLARSTARRFLTGKTVDCATLVGICGKLAIDWREISDKRISKVVQAPAFIRGINLKSQISNLKSIDLGDRVPSQSVEVKFSNVLEKHTITAQSCGNIINLLRRLQVDLSSY